MPVYCVRTLKNVLTVKFSLGPGWIWLVAAVLLFINHIHISSVNLELVLPSTNLTKNDVIPRAALGGKAESVI